MDKKTKETMALIFAQNSDEIDEQVSEEMEFPSEISDMELYEMQRVSTLIN